MSEPKGEVKCKEFKFILSYLLIMSAKNEGLEKLAKDAAEIASKLPEKFQEKGFEVVLNYLLGGKPILPITEETKQTEETAKPKFVVPIDVRAFLQQFNVAEEKLQKLFLMQGNEVRPIYQVETTKKATAQVQIAALKALESALKGGKFEFSVEGVRQACKEFRAYDGANFNSIFKKNMKLFKDMDDKEHVELSPDGKSELADAITEIAK